MTAAIRVVILWTNIDRKVVIKLFTVWQSDANLADNDPLAFLGLSNQGIGIFNIL